MLWQSRRWRRLLNLVDHLPRATHFHEAVAQDEEHAEMLLRSGSIDEQAAYVPPMSIWSPELETLTNIHDAIAALQVAVVRSAGGTTGNPPSSPRPITAVQRLNVRVRESQHNELVARLARLRAEADAYVAAGGRPEDVEMETLPGTGAVE